MDGGEQREEERERDSDDGAIKHPRVAKLQRSGLQCKPAQEWVTHPGPVLLQQVPHALHTQAHDQAEVAVWGVGADAVHGHDVLMGVHQRQLEAAQAAQGKGRGGWTHTHTRAHIQTWDCGTRYNKAHTWKEHSAENMTPSLGKKHTRAPVHGGDNPPTLNHYLMHNTAISQHLWQAQVH